MEDEERPTGPDTGVEPPKDTENDNKDLHEGFMREALSMVRISLLQHSKLQVTLHFPVLVGWIRLVVCVSK